MKKIFVLVASLFLCTLLANAQNNVIDNELQKILNQKGNDYIDVNIMLKAQMTSDDFAVLNCKSDSKEVRREIVTNELKKFAENSQKDIMSVLQAEERSMKVTDIQNFWIANFINCKAKADVIYQLASHPDVATISYNNVMEVVSDSKETESRDTRAVTATIGEHLKRIKADQVWDLGYTGKGVIVAVLDSGVNTEHADLKDHLWNGNAQYGYNVVNPGQNPYDDRSHGTHCAGIVCGDGTSGMMTGVAPDATLMSIKVYADGSGLTVPRLLEGVQFAAKNGAQILNISQGWLGATDANRNTLRTTFANLLAQNIVTVVAAGNDRENLATYPVPGNIRTPGDCPPPWLHPDQQVNAGGVSSVVSVGAVTYNEFNVPSIAAISSQGPVEWYDYPYNDGESMGLIRPDIVAPATIRSLSHDSNDGYVSKGGTSQAAPCVAGVMALMLEKNPNLTPEDLCKIVERTTTQTPAKKDNLYGSGVVDALEAVRAVPLDVNGPALNVYDFTRTFNAGSNLNLELTLINNGKTSTNDNTTVTISENDTYTTIVNNSATYGTMGVMNLEEAHSSEFIDDVTKSATFKVSFNKEIPDNYEVTFTVNTGSRTFDIVVTVYNELVAPTLNATANGTDINLSWNATNNAISYNIYRDGVFLANTPETSYTDADLEYGTIYAYTVTTKRGELESEHSLIARAQTADNPAKPSPTNVVATNNGTNVSVTWTNGAESKGSNIYRKDYLTGIETSIATNVNGTSYTDNTWNSLEGIYQYGVANLYAQNNAVYTENFTDLYLTNNNPTEIYPTMNAYWYIYQEGTSGGGGSNNYKWNLRASTTNQDSTYSAFSGNAAFIQSNYKNDQFLSYLVMRPMTYNEAVKLSFKYITPAWDGAINTLKVMVSTTSYNSGWTELWSSNKTDVQEWTDAVVDLSAYTGQQIYIAFVNVAGYGYCTGVDEVSIFIEGSSESRIEWSDIVSKNVNMFVQDGNWLNTDNWTAKRLPNENDTKVIIDANATIESGNITVNSLVINEGKTLTINDGVILTVNGDFANTDADAFIINDGAQVFQSNEDVSATFRMNIVNPEEWGTNETGWQFIASPLKYSKISDFVPSSSDYDLYKYDGTKDLEWLNHKDETTYDVPTTPQNLLAEATSTSTIALSWDDVVGASSYKVYFDATNFISTASNTFEVTGLMPGTEYCYSVAAVNAYGESDKSEACAKTITLAPQNLVANTASHDSIVLSWSSVTGAERYVVYKDSEVLAQFVTNPYYTVKDLTQATEYCFTVTAVNYLDGVNGKESAHSNKACATTDITIPSAPQNVVLVATSPYSVKLTWNPVAGAASYNIYLINGTPVVEGIQETEYIFDGLTPEGKYCYAVSAVNAKGESGQSGSNEVQTPLPTPVAPQLYARATAPATVELTWNDPDFAETYKVYEGNRLVVEGISSTTYTVYDLEAGEHCFTVIAVNSVGGESVESDPACATTTAQDPDTPIAEHIIIGDGNSTTGVLPLTSNQAYSISQQIYTRAEMQQTGEIKSVSFKYKSGLSAPCTRTVKVYLKQTTKEVFASKTDWLSMTDADLVYDGNITINGIADEWVRIKLDTPFEYTGNNLAVCVYDYTNSVDDQIIFAADVISDAKAMYYYNWMSPAPLNPFNVNKDGNIPSPTKRNQIRFSFVTGNEPAIPAAPANLIATCSQESTFIGTGDGGNQVYEYANAITLTWDADATAETYYIYDETDNIIGQTSGTTFTIDGLETARRYCYYVSAENETGEGAKAEVCTTTITARPQNLIVEAIDYTTINLSWTPVEGATSYNIYEGNNYTPDADATFIGNTDVCSYDVENLTKGMEYCYFVKAVNEGGESFRSPAECANTNDVQYTCAVKFELIDSYGDSWNGNVLYVTYGDVTEQMTVSSGSTATYILDIPTGSTCYIKYKPEGSYQDENTFIISYYGGDEIYSSTKMKNQIHEDLFVVNCEPSAAAVPTITAAPISDKQIVLTMESSGATRFNIYKDGELLVKGVKEDTYTVDNLDPSTNYCFTATASNVLGKTEQSEPACATTYEVGTTIVQVGGNGTYTSSNTPIYDYYMSRSVTQTIYTQEEIANSAGFIKSISYKNAQGANNTRNIAVYLKNTDSEYFSTGTSAWESLEDAVCVYQGNFTFGTTDWVEIETQEDFLYEGGNLLVCVIDNTGVSISSITASDKFYVYSVGTNNTDNRSIYGTGSSSVENITNSSYPVKNSNGTEYVSPIAKFRMTEVPPFVEVTPETIALGKVQLGEYWSEKEDVTVSVIVKPINTTITNITCDNPFFSVSGIDYTAKSMNLTVSYDKNASAGEKTGNLTITYGDGATKVVPMTATVYTPVTPDVYELAQSITFTDGVYTDTPVFANLNDDYNLPKEVNAGSTPDAVYTFELTEETPLTVNITGTNAVATIYSEDFNGKGGPMANNNNKGIVTPTTFFYDFNDGSLDAFNLIDKDVAKANYFNDSYNWIIQSGEGSDGSNVLISYSYRNSNPKIDNANNYIVTKEVYNISQASQLVFDARCQSKYDSDSVKVEVSTDGENFEYLTTVTPGMGIWEKVTVDLGTLLTEKGLEYGDYYIALHHDEHFHQWIMIDNLQLTDGSTRSVKSRAAEPQINAVPYPAGRYYLVAAAEDAFTVDFTIPVAPEIPEGALTTFFYDFEDQSLDAFNLINADDDVYNWIVVTPGITPGYSLKSDSYNNSYNPKTLYPDNYIVTKEKYYITANSKLSFQYLTSQYPDRLGVEVSTDGTNFVNVWSEKTALGGNPEYVTINLSEKGYAGQSVYIALRHYDSNGNEGFYVYVDNLQLTDGSAKSSAASAKMTDVKGGFEKVSAFGTSSGTELSKFETTFEQGVGYLASYETETVATFKGILNHETSFEFALDYNNGKDLANYHLLGNPFSFNMNWANTTANNDLVNGYAVVNEQGGYNYLTNGEIKVGDGFFVKAKGSNPTLTYNARSRNNEKQNFINVIASGKAGNDNVIINLAGEQEGFPKIKNFNEDIAVVYVYDNSTPYGIYNCESDVQEVELVFKANTFGEYNFHVETEGMFESITLFDKLTEAETNMLTGSYTFTTTPKENGNRFVLKFAKGEGSNEDDKFAFLSGNELIIEAEGVVQIVDVMGRVVYSNEVTSDNNRIDTSKFNTAAYIVRLITNDGIKTQKIVVY